MFISRDQRRSYPNTYMMASEDGDPPSYEDATNPNDHNPNLHPSGHELSDIVRDADCEWVRDDFPLWGAPSNELSERDKQLRDWAVSKRTVVTNGLAYYVYCRNAASWAQMESTQAACELLEQTDTMAPVNFAGALKKFHPLLKRVAYPVGRMDTSVCIGTWRLTYTIKYEDEGPVVSYKPHKEVIQNPRGPEHTRTYMFVVTPIVMAHPYACPVTFRVNMENYILNYIMAPLRDDQKIDFMWRIAMSLTHKRAFVIVFYGKDGHEGKGTLMENITRLLPGVITWMSDDLIGVKSKWPKEDVVVELCEKRILVCDEVEISDGFSYNNIKRWTSNSPVSSGTSTSLLSQTIVALSNKIPFYSRGSTNNSIGRRLVVYHMKKEMGKMAAMPTSVFSNKMLLMFISMCLSVGEAYPNAPPSLPIALYSQFHKSVNKITAGLKYDTSCSDMDAVAGTNVMAMRCGTSPKVLCSAFNAWSPQLVGTTPNGTQFIKSIRKSKRSLTPYGHDRVIAQRSKITYNLENLKTIVRLI
jgi:hypothetical protein